MTGRLLMALLASAGLLVACTGADVSTSEGPAISWTERTLPAPPGSSGRSVVRDAVRCGAAWYVVGAGFLDQPTDDRNTRPAAWRSADGVTWTPIKVDARTFWGRRAILNSVACSNKRISVVGARSGGAHGNPRVTTFYLDPSGRLVGVRTTFVQYGGISATNVGPISGGPTGWLIAGNRVSGPGVWVTDDPRGFTRVEGEPGLTDDGDLESLAQASGWAGEGWVLVGAGARTGRHLDRDPLAWTSTDGLAWRAQAMPAEPETEDVHRVVALPDGRLLAVGVRGDTFAAWVRDADGRWQRSVRFGMLAELWRGSPYVASLAVTSTGVLATVSTGTDYELWHSGDGADWQRLTPPLAPETASDHALVAGSGDPLLLLADNGGGARVWTGSSKSR
ncbi:MAG: hypothetical protein ACRCYU_08580 [Nocardioides sp.]